LQARVAGLLGGLLFCATAAVAGGEIGAFKTLRLEGNAVRWQLPAQGRGLVVSYSVVVQDVAFTGARNCRKMTTLDGLLATSQIAPAVARTEIAAAFAMWQAVAGIDFREAESAEQADILIGAQAEPEGWAFADVFYDVLSREPVKPISRALVCLNPVRQWKVGFDGDLQRYDLRYTIAHEIGHAIGLDHPVGAGQIMGYRYEERFRELQTGDVSGAIQLYGKRPAEAVIATSAPSTTQARRISPARRYAKRWGSRAFTAPAP
jgi:matrixin